MASTQANRRLALKARATETAERLTARKSGLPEDFQTRFDVRVTLRTAIRDAKVKEKDIKDGWKPKDAGFDVGGWEAILKDFTSDLRALSGVYKPFKHQSRFADDTNPKPLSEIEDYLSAKVAQAMIQPVRPAAVAGAA